MKNELNVYLLSMYLFSHNCAHILSNIQRSWACDEREHTIILYLSDTLLYKNKGFHNNI